MFSSTGFIDGGAASSVPWVETFQPPATRCWWCTSGSVPKSAAPSPNAMMRESTNAYRTAPTTRIATPGRRNSTSTAKPKLARNAATRDNRGRSIAQRRAATSLTTVTRSGRTTAMIE
ncbi:hypothetical protein VT84_17740 [Gemmata sp. SH-PL17]|nr:hypothetical protein VT84_17740 [Gemmata sp. SH-PL17]